MIFLFPFILLLSSGTLAEETGWSVPLVTFGMIADPHANINHRQPWWCDLACWKKEIKLAASSKGRKHHTVLGKVTDAVETLARIPGISFSMNMGDLCDMDLLVNMPPVLKIWDTLKHPHYNLMGNHDLRGENDRFGEPSRLRNKTQIAWLLKEWNLKEHFFYAFSYGPVRFIVLDSMNLPPTSGEGVFEKRGKPTEQSLQLQWLQKELDETQTRGDDVIIFAHIPIGLKSNAIRSILTRYDHILAMFFGHKHSGGYYYHSSGKHMITVQGMIETNVNAFAYINVFLDRIELVGFGRVPSQTYYKTQSQKDRALARSTSVYAPLLHRYLEDPHFSASRESVKKILASKGPAGTWGRGYEDPLYTAGERKGLAPLHRAGDKEYLKTLPEQVVNKTDAAQQTTVEVQGGEVAKVKEKEKGEEKTATESPGRVVIKSKVLVVGGMVPGRGAGSGGAGDVTQHVLLSVVLVAVVLVVYWRRRGLKRHFL